MATIQNYKGLPLSPYPCESWMEFWNTHSDQWIIWCAEVHCRRVALVASLVKILEKENDHVYVVPLCKGHAVSTHAISIGRVKPVKVT
jgi:hypothetical protein